MLTIDDLRNPKRASAFDRVGVSRAHGHHSRPFYAQTSNSRGTSWRGPRRATAEEAAQDYCDHINGQAVPLATRAPLRRAKSEDARRDRLPDDPEVQAALGVLRDARGQREGRQGYVYLIIEMRPGGELKYGKIGYSTKPPARVGELQTGNPRPLKLHAMKLGTLATEAALHAKYAAARVVHGGDEWFWLGHASAKELLLEFDLNEHGIPWDAGKEAA